MRVTNCTNLSISVSDPLLMYIRVLSYRTRLKDVFDNTIIGVSGCQGDCNYDHVKIIKDFFYSLQSNTDNLKVDFFENDQGNHGLNIGTVVSSNWNNIKDTILLMEDDDFIINDELLVEYLKRIKNRELDFVGGTRGCCSNADFINFEKQIIRDDNLLESFEGDFQPHFWPTHFMIHKSLLNSDDVFANHVYKAGTEIDFRGRKYKFEYDTVGDTMVYFCVNMWNRVKKGIDHKLYTLGTPEYVDKFNYNFHSGLLPNWLKLEEYPEKIALKALQFHIGSASCLRRFWINDIDILNEEMFRQIDQFINNKGDTNGIIEIYRRYYLYKIIFNIVKNDSEFSTFKNGYEYNFAKADEYFNRIGINDIFATKDFKMMPESIYDVIFRYIIGR